MLPSCHMHRYLPWWGNSYRCVAILRHTSSKIERLSIGMKRFPAGRIGEAPSVGLSGSLRSAGFQLGRLQTGTPARILKDSIDFSRMDVQPGDAVPRPFSFLNKTVDNAVGCFSHCVSHILIDCACHAEQSGRLLPDTDVPCYTPSRSRQLTPELSHTRDETRCVALSLVIENMAHAAQGLDTAPHWRRKSSAFLRRRVTGSG